MEKGGIFETQDGSHSIFSSEFGVSYHSKYGAIQETEHVFIKGGLYAKALEQKNIAILELGFGTGLNAFVSFLETQKKALIVDYETIEAFPISLEQAMELNYPMQLKVPEQAEAFLQMHQCKWSEKISLSEHFTFKKVLQKFEDIQYDQKFDLIYFDAFAPNAQPELWEPFLLEKTFNALKSQGLLVTYCAKGIVKRRLKDLGFEVEALPGPPGKREMTRGRKP